MCVTNQRQHKRINSKRLSHLQLRGSSYVATVKNISASGALVHFYDMLPGVLVGDTCKLGLKGGPFLKEYDCKVVRVEPSDIALRFIGITM